MGCTSVSAFTCRRCGRDAEGAAERPGLRPRQDQRGAAHGWRHADTPHARIYRLIAARRTRRSRYRARAPRGSVFAGTVELNAPISLPWILGGVRGHEPARMPLDVRPGPDARTACRFGWSRHRAFVVGDVVAVPREQPPATHHRSRPMVGSRPENSIAAELRSGEVALGSVMQIANGRLSKSPGRLDDAEGKAMPSAGGTRQCVELDNLPLRLPRAMSCLGSGGVPNQFASASARA